ncbi:glycosyltransferase [Zobellia amurskyensis]|uniref:Glycosyltransferase n=1 Tax=Zobellia amurskyensis TaxID=248905 RepID=A0A7X2ZV30_9FLAO|nr:glycosyltransferase [Zobellia amurskyensis]MUH36912.1 glycosyltransferase [Zobellia amurskyensis]
MTHKKLVYFVLPTLGAGGAERVMSYVAQNLNKDLFIVKLIVIGLKKNQAFEVDNIEVIFFEKSRVLNGFFPLFNLLRKTKPNVVITAISHLNGMAGILSLLFVNIKFIGREANVQSVLKNHSNSTRNHNIIFKKILRFGTKKLDALICQSKDMKADIIQLYDYNEAKLITINNPIADKIFLKKTIPLIQNGVYKFITVGRLAKQKGHKRIIKALSKITLPYQYTIIGDGPEKEDIFEYAKVCGIFNKINHIPFTKEVYSELSNHHLFLQGSYVEGFPNALLESCAIGTPAIAFKALGGIDEIIEEGVNGFVVENSDECVKRIEFVIQSLPSWTPEKVGRSVRQKYSSNKIMYEYEQLLLNT